MTAPIAITKIRRSYFLTVNGVKLPGRFSSFEEACQGLASKADFYRYWAESVGTSVLGTSPKVVSFSMKLP